MKTFITGIFVCLLCTLVTANTRKADRLFEKWQYAEAAQLYQKEADKHPSAEVYDKLGQCYQKMFRFREAATAYDKVKSYGDNYSRTTFYLDYGLVLKANGRYDEARDAFNKYDSLAPSDMRGKFYATSCDTVISDNKKQVAVTASSVTAINDRNDAFSPALYNGGIVYAANSPAAKGNKTFPWDGKGYLDLYYAKRGNSDTDFNSAGPFNTVGINTKYHDGPATFSKNGDTIYFNRVSRDLKGREKRTIGVEHAKIYWAVQKDGKWSDPEPFAYNSDSYAVFTPYLTPDGSRLYFASDMPGGMGETDIYYCTRNGDGWSAPVNAGPNVNTFGREQFPTVDSAGDLYFASDAYMGYGGLDICVSRKSGDGFEKGQVLKAPLNSASNDYGLVFVKDDQVGYFSTERNGNGDADIYYFNLPADSIPCPISTETYVIGYECNPKKPDIVAEVIDSSVYLHPSIDLSHLGIGPVYFDFDKSNIRPDAATRLDSIASMLRAHPDWDIILSGGADCRGSSEYNMALSQRRAESAKSYLSNKGISASRMKTQAFGESKLVNRCTDGVDCTEAQHQLNRRVESKVSQGSNPVGSR